VTSALSSRPIQYEYYAIYDDIRYCLIAPAAHRTMVLLYCSIVKTSVARPILSLYTRSYDFILFYRVEVRLNDTFRSVIHSWIRSGGAVSIIARLWNIIIMSSTRIGPENAFFCHSSSREASLARVPKLASDVDH